MSHLFPAELNGKSEDSSGTDTKGPGTNTGGSGQPAPKRSENSGSPRASRASKGTATSRASRRHEPTEPQRAARREVVKAAMELAGHLLHQRIKGGLAAPTKWTNPRTRRKFNTLISAAMTYTTALTDGQGVGGGGTVAPPEATKHT